MCISSLYCVIVTFKPKYFFHFLVLNIVAEIFTAIINHQLFFVLRLV